MTKTREPQSETWRDRWYEIIFEHDTPAGKRFDVWLLAAILLSVLVVMLESVEGLKARYGSWLFAAEWAFTFLFTVEYVVRILVAKRSWRYVFSFFGIVDLLSILPTYLTLFPGISGSQGLATVRSLRLLRAFRIFKIGTMLSEADALKQAVYMSRSKVAVFLSVVVIAVVIVGSAMYLVEGPENGFTSIPLSMYWAIVTMTTVGYGDIAPITPLGKGIAGLMMLFGYSLIIVPTGFVSAELAGSTKKPVGTLSVRTCRSCLREGHDRDATYCKYCGEPLTETLA